MNLREVRKKIKSIQNVKKITKAMQMVSSVKMRKAQRVALDGRPYREALEKMINRVTGSGAGEMGQSAFVKAPETKTKKHVVILITSNKGLAGSFLTTIHRFVLRKLDYDNTEFITLGNKGAQFLAITKGNITADFSSHKPELQVNAIFDLIKERWLTGQIDSITVLHNKFINTLKFETLNEQILPVSISEIEATKDTAKMSEEALAKSKIPYTIEPLSKELTDSLLESYIEEKIRGAILNSLAAEHSARMIAMKNATDNATDVIYSLTLAGNKLRQEKITSELLDMITAKESVEA